MEKAKRFMKIVPRDSLFGKESDRSSIISSVGARSKSLESFQCIHKQNLRQFSSCQIIVGNVREDYPGEPLEETTDHQSTPTESTRTLVSDEITSSESLTTLRSVHHHLGKESVVSSCPTLSAHQYRRDFSKKCSSTGISTGRQTSAESVRTVRSLHHHLEQKHVVSSCPTVSVHRYRRDLAKKWSSAGVSTGFSDEDSCHADSEDNAEEIKDVPPGVDFSNVFRERSKTWAGDDIRPYKPISHSFIRSSGAHSDDEGVLVYYLDNPRDKLEHFKSEFQKNVSRPCVCRPSQPPSIVCSSLMDEDSDQNQMIYLKILMIWVTFFIKLILFTSLWALLLYWFLTSAGFVNVVPEPIILQEEWNSYIEKYQDFKWLAINNTYDSVELEVRLQGPFADSNVFFNCQYERLYFLGDTLNRSDVRIDDAEAVEVDHRIYEDSYSAVTSTTTRRTMTYVTTLLTRVLAWRRTYYIEYDKIVGPGRITYWQRYWTYRPYTASRSMTWWTFTTITARLTRYNLSRHPMTSFTVQEPYNFVPWGNERIYGYSFRNFRAIGGRYHGHRHYANSTPDSNITVIYGLKYMLNMSTFGDLVYNEGLDAVAFAIEITKGMGYTTTTTTPAPPIVIHAEDGVKYGLVLVGFILALLFLQTNRVLALFVMAAACVSILSFLHIRPGAETIVTWLNLDYIFELIFVMILVGVTADTGFYDLVAFTIHKLCFGSIFGISCIMCVSSFALSVVMDSVAAILMLTPIAVRTVEQGQMNPTPVLMSMILYSNMASVLDADYNYVNYNILKGNDRWQATEAAFQDTKIHQKTMPGVILCAAVTAVYLAVVFKWLKPHVYSNPDVAGLIHRQILLRIAASSINRNSKNWEIIRNQLIEWHHEIDQERLRRLAEIDPLPNTEQRYNKIRDYMLLLKVGIVVGIFLLLFVVRIYGMKEIGGMSIGMIVVACMGYLLLLVNPNNLNSLLRRMEWSTIIGLLCIFFIERSLETMRLNKRLFLLLTGMLPKNPSTDAERIAYFLNVMRYMQWGSFLMSAIFSNFSAVTTMRILATRFGDIFPDRVADLVYAITFGCNVGGSASVLGTGVSIACTASAWQQGYRVSACKYFIFMLPITLVNLLCVYFSWTGIGS